MISSSKVRKDANHKSLKARGRDLDKSRKKRFKERVNISKWNREYLHKGKNTETEANNGNGFKSGYVGRYPFI